MFRPWYTGAWDVWGGSIRTAYNTTKKKDEVYKLHR